MNEGRDSSYYILGIQPGASPSEVKSAFRRLAKLYHPDHDQSLDAIMKYREIRAAYDELRKLPFSNETKTGSNPSASTQTAQPSESRAQGTKTQNNPFGEVCNEELRNKRYQKFRDDMEFFREKEHKSNIFSKKFNDTSDTFKSVIISIIIVFMFFVWVFIFGV